MTEKPRRKIAKTCSQEVLDTMTLLTGGGSPEVLKGALLRLGWTENADGTISRPVSPQFQAMQKQWESQRQELSDRVMILELENENLHRQLEKQDAEIERLRNKKCVHDLAKEYSEDTTGEY